MKSNNVRYLFRGKRSDNLRKTWVVGHYVSVPRPMIVFDELLLNGNWNVFDVDPATIGQCTGLCDKNGTLIFEGDIVNRTTACGEQRCGIEFREGSFRCTSLRYKTPYIINVPGETLEIIGNIYDNPELVE